MKAFAVYLIFFLFDASFLQYPLVIIHLSPLIETQRVLNKNWLKPLSRYFYASQVGLWSTILFINIEKFHSQL